MRRVLVPVVLAAALAGCGAPADGLDVAARGEDGKIDRAAVYGSDDRVDVHAVPDEEWRALARASSVAIVDAAHVDDSDPRDVRLLGPTLAEAYGLCPDERFVDQPSVARCSGVLVDDDLVLTAGHCVDPARFDCTSDTRFVFGFEMTADGAPAVIDAVDVYGCAEVVAFARGARDDGVFDHAIVRLDRKIGGARAPASLRPTTSPVAMRDRVAVVGYPSGLPLKLDDGGRVLDPRKEMRDFFVATTDTFGGSSGSAVFDAARGLVGVLVRGAIDYVEDGSCDVAAVYPATGEGAGEEISYAAVAVAEACADGYGTVRLCEGRCFGDDCDDPVKARTTAVDELDPFGDGAPFERVTLPTDGEAASCAQSRGAPLLVALVALLRRRRSG